MLLRINEFSGYANYCHRFCSSPLNIQITELKSQSSSWLIFKWRKTNDVCTKFLSTFGWLSPMNNQLDYLKKKNTAHTKKISCAVILCWRHTFISFYQMHFCNIFQALRSPKVLHGGQKLMDILIHYCILIGTCWFHMNTVNQSSPFSKDTSPATPQ